ncbi:MAG: hypothetical protein K2X97_21405 [Mycobacteriaceae bacterium]|nr:hypothetical protein [Mycobacteriaceae bacterium]
MADTSHLPPEVLYALRTGKLPAHLAKSDREAAAPEKKAGKDDAERFRQGYHAMVEEGIADWLDENPGYGKSIPEQERTRIEAYCERQIQHQWRTFLRQQDGLDGQDEVYGPW